MIYWLSIYMVFLKLLCFQLAWFYHYVSFILYCLHYVLWMWLSLPCFDPRFLLNLKSSKQHLWLRNFLFSPKSSGINFHREGSIIPLNLAIRRMVYWRHQGQMDSLFSHAISSKACLFLRLNLNLNPSIYLTYLYLYLCISLHIFHRAFNYLFFFSSEIHHHCMIKILRF